MKETLDPILRNEDRSAEETETNESILLFREEDLDWDQGFEELEKAQLISDLLNELSKGTQKSSLEHGLSLDQFREKYGLE